MSKFVTGALALAALWFIMLDCYLVVDTRKKPPLSVHEPCKIVSNYTYPETMVTDEQSVFVVVCTSTARK